MATYTELYQLGNEDNALRNRVAVALVIEAQTILSGTPTAAQAGWAAKVIANPTSEAKSALYTVLAANSSATVAQIQGATDAAVQANVAAIVDALVLAEGA